MQIPKLTFVRHWQALLMLAVVPALTNCSRIDGSVELNNSAGEPYSFEGAKVQVFDLNRSVVLPGATKTPKGTGSVKDGAISAQIITALVEDDALYDVEIQCPANNSSDACNVESPLHIVLSGAQLKISGWTATALSEAIFQNVAYYAATDYPVTDIQQMLDVYAGVVLVPTSQTSDKNYHDVLAWNAGATDAVKRPVFLGSFSESLAQGVNDPRLLARQWLNPDVTSFSSSALGFKPAAIAIADSYAYVSGNGFFEVFDVSKPDQPISVGHAEDVGAINAIFISGTMAYAQTSTDFQVIDISNPQQPAVTGKLSIATGILRNVTGNYAYVTTPSALQIFNISNPQQPVLTAQIDLPNIGNVAIVGERLYFVTDQTLHTYNISNPAAPIAEGTLLIAGAQGASGNATSQLAVLPGRLYVTTHTAPGVNGLDLIDLYDPAAPWLTTVAGLPITDAAKSLTVSGTNIYLATASSLSVIDASDSELFWVPHQVTYPYAYPDRAIAVTGDFAYAVSSEGLSIIDPSPRVVRIVWSGIVDNDHLVQRPFALADSYAYLANQDFGFDVFDLTNPVKPEQGPGLENHTVSNIVTSGDYAFFNDNEFGAIRVANISNRLLPVDLPGSTIYFEDNDEFFGVDHIALSGNTLFASWGSAIDTGADDGEGNPPPSGQMGCTNAKGDAAGGLFMIGVSVPETPSILEHTCLADRGKAVAADANHAYVAVAGGLLQVVPYDGVSLGSGGTATLSAEANFVAVQGNYVWAAEGHDGIEVVDVSNANVPVVVKKINTHGYAQHVLFDQRYAYVADGNSGLLIFDTGNPATPALVASVSTRGGASSIFLAGDYLYGGTSFGIEIFKALPATSN